MAENNLLELVEEKEEDEKYCDYDV